MTAIAHMVAHNGRAMIKESDGRTYLLSHDDAEPQKWDPKSVDDPRLYLWDFFDSPTVETVDDIGEYPYEKLHECLRCTYGIGVLLNSFCPILSLEQRLQFARRSEKRLANPEFRQFVEAVINEPLDVADRSMAKMAVFDGLPEDGQFGEILRAYKKKWAV